MNIPSFEDALGASVCQKGGWARLVRQPFVRAAVSINPGSISLFGSAGEQVAG
jgi:hypothetical protein